jgi:hypothetical protein
MRLGSDIDPLNSLANPLTTCRGNPNPASHHAGDEDMAAPGEWKLFNAIPARSKLHG